MYIPYFRTAISSILHTLHPEISEEPVPSLCKYWKSGGILKVFVVGVCFFPRDLSKYPLEVQVGTMELTNLQKIIIEKTT